MGLTKSEIFTDKQNKLSRMMKALAHPARIAIIQQLVSSNTCICGDLVDELGLAQATISQHLKELKNEGLLKGPLKGPAFATALMKKPGNNTRKNLTPFFVAYEPKNNCVKFFPTSIAMSQ
jgi:predicted transcriptional regulator